MDELPVNARARVCVFTTDVTVLETLSGFLGDRFKLEWVKADAWPRQTQTADGELVAWVDSARLKLRLAIDARWNIRLNSIGR